MAVLPSGQKPVVMTRYTHMLYEDVEVWTRFLKGTRPEIFELWYDVHVGKAMPVPEGASQVEAAVAAAVSRKRIDVVCRVAGGYWVVEVKPFGNMVALGQSLAYCSLFQNEYQVSGLVLPVVVCDLVDEDLARRFAELGVLVFETGYKGLVG